jgi:hypothetical protein
VADNLLKVSQVAVGIGEVAELSAMRDAGSGYVALKYPKIAYTTNVVVHGVLGSGLH